MTNETCTEDDAVMTFGKYADQTVSSVPDSYLLWCAQNMPRIPCYVVDAMNARGLDVEPSWTDSVTEMAGMLYYRPSDCREREARSRLTKKGMKFWRRQSGPRLR
jgi:hypothetical protein